MTRLQAFLSDRLDAEVQGLCITEVEYEFEKAAYFGWTPMKASPFGRVNVAPSTIPARLMVALAPKWKPG